MEKFKYDKPSMKEADFGSFVAGFSNSAFPGSGPEKDPVTPDENGQ